MRKTVRARRHASAPSLPFDWSIQRSHSNCNLNYKDSHYIPVVFHNLSGYDAHFIIKEIATAYEGQVDLLPITKEKYISFTKNIKSTENKDKKTYIKLQFIDSY